MFLEGDRKRAEGAPHGNPGVEAEAFSGDSPWEHLRARAHPHSRPDVPLPWHVSH